MRLTVDLGALRRNYRLLRDTAPTAIVMAAVKADAYSMGREQVARALTAEGCSHFLVENIDEAILLRSMVPDAAIYVVFGFFPGETDDLIRHNLRPILTRPEQVREWAAIPRGDRPGCALKVNSGMNRLGLGAEEFEQLVADPGLIKALGPDLLMSHLAFSQDPDHEMNRRQLATFQRLSALLPDVPASLAGSGAAMAGPEYHFDMIRPGIGLYGGNPYADRANPFESVAHLEGRILQIHKIDSGESVGYGATHIAEKPTRIAIVGTGYSGGYGRGFDNVGYAMLDGVRLPILGRVSMGSVAMDVGECPEGSARPGRMVSLLGGGVSLDDASKGSGRSPYEILVTLGLQQNRVYVGSESA